MEKKKLFLTLFLGMAIIGINGCSTKQSDKDKFQVIIVDAPLQCSEEPQTLHAECKCPQSTEGIATIISSVGSVIGNLISTLWD